MLTFRGGNPDLCVNCGASVIDHEIVTDACPRPAAPALTAAERDMLDLCSRYCNGEAGAEWDAELETLRRRHDLAHVYAMYDIADVLEKRCLLDIAWDLTPAGRAVLDATKPTEEPPPPSASLVATVDVLRALTPEQREALMRIGPDAVALLSVARRSTNVGAAADLLRPELARLAAVLTRIEARKA